MYMYDELWHDLNNLLSCLRASGVQKLVDEKYAKFNNDAPGWVLNERINRVQAWLDNAQRVPVKIYEIH